MKKLLRYLTCITLIVSLCALFASCDMGGDDSSAPQSGGYETYVMEAEYIDLTGIQGGGVSYEKSGVNMIYGNGTDAEKELGWSNGYYVYATDADGLSLKFVFDSASATKGVSLTLRLGNENGTFEFNPDNLVLKLNGEEIDYSPITIKGPVTLDEMTFKDYTVATNLSLKKGENEISFTVKNAGGGYTTGPRIDCIKLKSKSKLNFHAKTGNIAERDNSDI